MDNTKTLHILYHFQYTPQSWREWQRIASIKIQMMELVPHLTFSEYETFDEVERVYTITELGRFFPKFIKYHKQLYPSGKDEFMRSLTLYCQRLHYEKQLHIEAVIAMALHFNSKCNLDYSYREIMKKAKSVMQLDRSSWRVKLLERELKEAYIKRNILIAQDKRDKSQPIRDKAKALKSNGATLKSISKQLGISLSTVRRYLV